MKTPRKFVFFLRDRCRISHILICKCSNMFYLTSQTRNITCFIRNTELKANQTGLFCSALVNSLSRKISYKSFPRTKCIQGTIKRSFSGGWLQRIQSMPNIRDRGVCWFEEEFYWTNKRIHSMTGIHGNVANFRKFSTSGHSEKKSEIFGEWVGIKFLQSNEKGPKIL